MDRTAIERSLTDHARALAPVDPRLGRTSLKEAEVLLLSQVAGLLHARHGAAPVAPPAAAPAASAEPAWITIGKRKVGEREIPGVKHNPWILQIWQAIRAPWFTDDETPWCAGFVAWCLQQAGLPILPPAVVARAKAWADYGTACRAQVGAIGVKSRSGGGHTFFIVGQTADGRFFKVLEGNANNMVRIGDIAKADVIAIRWPPGVPQANLPLPVMPKGAIARTEA